MGSAPTRGVTNVRGVSMKRRIAACVVVAISMSAAATASSATTLPAIKAGPKNEVPACVTPGRLTAFLKSRNSALDRRFEGIALEYMRHGETLGVRWDYAFFQMMLETGNLAYKRGNGKPGDVKPTQNNFAGLGATGGGVPGESFPDVAAGVKAHLQHVLMYSGDKIDDPVAERTRKVQEWGVLTNWQKTFKAPITFTDLGRQWAPGSRGYVTDIGSIADAFFDDWCDKPDPAPQLVQEARTGIGIASGTKTAAAAAAKSPAKPARETEAQPQAAAADVEPKVSGSDLARQALERAKTEGATRSGLGASAARPPVQLPAENSAPALADAPIDPLKKFLTLLNPSQPEAAPAAPLPDRLLPEAAVAEAPAAGGSKTPDKADNVAKGDKPAKTQGGAGATVQLAAAATTAKSTPPAKAPKAAEKTPGKCRVFTASYGGQKSIIIKAADDAATNYTVLDVNEGAEDREVAAYIAAYAKGGNKVGEFNSQTIALDKAFELCPEG